MTSIREQCGCGSAIRIDHSDDPAPIAAAWRGSHPCDRRAGTERDITAGATAEVAYTEPHPTDSRVRQQLGFHAVCLDGDDVPQVARRWVAIPR